MESVENNISPYFTLIHNHVPVTTLFEVSQNLFNFKMEVVTETMYRNGNDTNDTLKAFKQFLYYIVRENVLADIDKILLVFRSEKDRKDARTNTFGIVADRERKQIGHGVFDVL